MRHLPPGLGLNAANQISGASPFEKFPLFAIDERSPSDHLRDAADQMLRHANRLQSVSDGHACRVAEMREVARRHRAQAAALIAAADKLDRPAERKKRP